LLERKTLVININETISILGIYHVMFMFSNMP
jgi:hypothetical protein